MSETEPVLEPVPVTKDKPVANGNNDIDLPPPEPELQNGLNKPDMEMSNGVGESSVNGDNVADGEPGPVNGDCNGPDDTAEENLMGVDELPPPPEIVPDLPPPPQDGDSQDLLQYENDPYGSSVDPCVESSVDQDPQDVEDIECVDDNEDLMNVSDSETNQEENVQQNIEVPKHEEVSEEELVSDSGLQDEVEVEIQNNQENEEVEQMNEGQLIDLGETEQHEETSAALIEPSAPLVDLSEPLEPEVPAESEVQPVEPEIQPVEEVAQPEDVQSEAVESIPEPEPIEEPESVPVEEPVSMPVTEEVVESPQEPEREPSPEPEPAPVIQQQVEPDVPESEPVEKEPQQPDAEVMPQVGYAEPAIVVDNKPAEEEVEVPPPPPPPLVDETPPPPPPLDENIPLRRVSGSSTPNKQSPSKEIESPVAITAPMNVAVVSPQPEPIGVGQEVEQQPEPVPVPVQVKTEPLAQPAQPPHPVAVVAPQVMSEEVSPPSSSPPGSPSTVSEHAPSESEKPEAEPVTVVSPQVSQKINKKNFKNKIKFGVDLVEASLKQLHFLYIVNKNPGLYEEWLFKKAVRRYEAFWLPLAAEHKKESLAAPLDIEWVWHCHMLAPAAYEADSKNIAGLVVEHKLMSEKDRTKSLEKSRKYWTAKYPNEPFEIDLVYKEKVVEETPAEEPKPVEENATENDEAKESETKEADVEVAKEVEVVEEADKPAEGTEADTTEGEANAPTEAPVEPTTAAPEPAPAPEPTVPTVPEEGYEQKSSYNIFSAIARQQVFFYQVSLPHFHDKHFLKSAQKRYQRFLFLKHQNPTEMIVPCYDIDVMWHSHQLHPSVYKHDTVKVLGQILRHDDSVNDRSSGSTLMRADQKTRDLWKEHFGDTFMTFGAMFRGDPPVLCERMSMIEPVETYAFSTKKATVNLDKVHVEGLPEEINKYSVRLAYGGYNEKEGPLIKQFKGNKKKIEFENTKKGLAHFVFDTKEYDRLKFNMSQQIGFACTGHDEEIGEQIFSLMPVVENIPKDKLDPSALTETVKIDIDEEQNLKATFSATIEPPKQGPTMLYMNPGNYETRFCIMPEQIVQMWGPIPLPRLPAGRDNHCIVASHKFVNHTGEVTFTCRVIHSLPLLMSAVQVFYHNRMAAVAHLVGSDQIPQPSQLADSKKIFSLNPGDGQRAVLIKNQHGDWGIIRGQWTGFKKHQPAVSATKGKKAKKEVPWNPGTLSVSFYKCATGAWQHITLPYLQENFRFTIQDANVDLRSGTIEINSESNEVAENLSLAFSVALLHVLCQPRYKPPPPPEPIPVTIEPPPPSPEKKEAPKEEEEKPKEEATPLEGAEGESQPAEGEAQEEAPKVEEEKPKEQPKTPKSPAKSEPPTPSKKVKEVPPIPTFELGLVLAAGYNVDTATNENIKKQYGANACAGCSAVGLGFGVGIIGDAAADTAVEAETVEVVEHAGDEAEEAGDHGDDVGGQDQVDMDVDAGGMDGMGDVGDAGAASCAAF